MDEIQKDKDLMAARSLEDVVWAIFKQKQLERFEIWAGIELGLETEADRYLNHPDRLLYGELERGEG